MCGGSVSTEHDLIYIRRKQVQSSGINCSVIKVAPLLICITNMSKPQDRNGCRGVWFGFLWRICAGSGSVPPSPCYLQLQWEAGTAAGSSPQSTQEVRSLGDPREARTHRKKKISASTNQRDADVSDSERRSEGDPDGAGVIRLGPHQLVDMSGMFYTQEINYFCFVGGFFSYYSHWRT